MAQHTLNKNFSVLFFFVFVLIIILTNIVFQNFFITDATIYQALEDKLTHNRILNLIETQNKWKWVSYILVPVVYLIKFTLTSFCIYVGTILVFKKAKFKDIFQFTMIAETVFLLPAIIKIFWFIFILPDYNLEEIQYFSPFSLLNYLGYENVPSWSIYLLQIVNLFEIFYWLLLAYGLHIVINKPFKRSLGIVAASYGTGLVLWVTFITFLTVSIGK